MAWIESHQELGRHPKTRKLARQLEVSLPAVVGHLHYLWWWAMDFADDGMLGRYDVEEIADAALYEGDAHLFVERLISCGFLDDFGAGDGSRDWRLHDWDEYAGKLLAQRKSNAQRQRTWRDRQLQPALQPALQPTLQPAPPEVSDMSPSPNAHITVTRPLRNPTTVPN
ncbi:MAG: hypothetical protein ABI068_13460, partial [Ktedonobacterales bacterium]